jgi:transcription elongation factor Elf1
MPEVTCPRCGVRQPVGDGAGGYTCTDCGASWMFAACENCGVRFHMRPGTTDWTCPECGHEHGSATMGDFEPEEAQVDSEPAAVPAPSHLAPTAAGPAGRRPLTRARLATIAIVGIVAVLAIAFALSSMGGDTTAASSPSTSPSLTTTQALCLHLRDLQTPREDAFTRLADTLKADAVAIKAEGDTQLTAAVLRMRKAVLAYRDALAAHGDTSAASAEIADAYGGIPC